MTRQTNLGPSVSSTPNTATGLPVTWNADGTLLLPSGVSSPFPYRRIENNVAALGDSRMQQVYADSAQTRMQARHWFVQANALMGNRMLMVGNFAVAGLRSDQYLQYVANAIATNARWCIIWGVINDITAGVSALGSGGFWAGMSTAVDKLVAAGMNVIMVSETGISTLTSAQQGYVNQYNQLCREKTESTVGVYYFDINSALLDSATSVPTFRTGYSQDGTHTVTLGGAAGGVAYFAQFGGLFAPFGQQAANASDVGANGGIQLLTNPMWITATGATFGGGSPPTGAGPANWFADAPTGYTVVSSVTGQNWRLVITPNGAGTVSQYFFFLPGGSGANYGAPLPGYIYQCGCQVAVQASSQNYTGPQSRILLQLLTNGTNIDYQPSDLYAPVADGPGPTTAYTKTMKSPKFTVPSGWSSVTQWYFYVEHNFTAAGTATTIDLSSPWVRKRYS